MLFPKRQPILILVNLFRLFSANTPRHRLLLWLSGLGIGALLAIFAVLYGKLVLDNALARLNAIGQDDGLSAVLIGALILYALLLAIPFMPGIEVGIALLLLNGAQIAPFVYAATVAGLMMAFLIGRCIPLEPLETSLRRIGLRRPPDLLRDMRTTTTADRLGQYRRLLPRWASWIAIDYRYVSLGLLLNVPGTFAIGGGGGILIAVGLSRLFRGWLVLVTLLIATLPVPFTVWMMGTNVLSGLS